MALFLDNCINFKSSLQLRCRAARATLRGPALPVCIADLFERGAILLRIRAASGSKDGRPAPSQRTQKLFQVDSGGVAKKFRRGVRVES
jgi:hypothetical protein